MFDLIFFFINGQQYKDTDQQKHDLSVTIIYSERCTFQPWTNSIFCLLLFTTFCTELVIDRSLRECVEAIVTVDPGD